MASIPLLRFSLHPLSKPQFAQTPSPISLRFPHPLTPPLQSLSKTITSPRRRHGTRMSYTPTPAVDRLVSAAAYLLPFFNGLQYGRHLFMQYPILGSVFEPILPLLSLYRSVPYGSFVAFFALYLAVVRNPSFDRYVRFNAMQAVVLDVLLALPMLVQRIFNPGRAGLGYRLMVMGHNAVFVFVVFCFVYSFVSCILGRTPYLPFVADAAGRQL
uniref:Protein TIC 20 n=2 Tax=Kalanchoe fedtschenkoi TaxID=63787 RepID=A0A7N0TBE1_KALFE